MGTVAVGSVGVGVGVHISVFPGVVVKVGLTGGDEHVTLLAR